MSTRELNKLSSSLLSGSDLTTERSQRLAARLANRQSNQVKYEQNKENKVRVRSNFMSRRLYQEGKTKQANFRVKSKAEIGKILRSFEEGIKEGKRLVKGG